ncbi:MAG: polymerase subunit delta [Chloroflexota bacterium]|jgi:DNA polymerase-3 subunit delta|nr:polymerase subunit delta [Chloroflexota bacterium]
MLYLVSGREEFLREEFVGQLKALMRKLPLGEHNIDELGAGTSVADLIAACDVTPFLSEKRMVIVRGMVSQLGRARGGRRPRARAASPAPAETDESPLAELGSYVGRLPDTTHLVLVEEDAATLQPLAVARPDAVKRDFARLRDDALPGWIVDRARKQGFRISQPAARELAQLVGSDLRRLGSELDKLAAFVDEDQTIEAQHLEGLIAGGGPTIFALHDALAERRAAAALGATRSLLNDGSDPAELFAQVVGLVRRLLVVKELTAERRPLTREAPAFGLTSSQFALEKLQRQAARHSIAELEQAYAMLAQSDLAIKRGRVDPELALEMAVAQLVGIMPTTNAPSEDDEPLATAGTPGSHETTEDA